MIAQDQKLATVSMIITSLHDKRGAPEKRKQGEVHLLRHRKGFGFHVLLLAVWAAFSRLSYRLILAGF